MRGYLLDTHVLLWWLAYDENQPPRRQALASRHRKVLEDPAVEVFASAVSVWEIAIKRALGKLEAPPDAAAAIRRSNLDSLGITIDHAQAVTDLPHHHSDPFDRLLIAQAVTENLTIATVDSKIEQYDVAIL